MLRKLDEEYQNWGLTINTNKTEYIVIGNTSRDILLKRGVVEGVDSYKYLGVMISKDGTSTTEIKNHIEQEKQVTSLK